MAFKTFKVADDGLANKTDKIRDAYDSAIIEAILARPKEHISMGQFMKISGHNSPAGVYAHIKKMVARGILELQEDEEGVTYYEVLTKPKTATLEDVTVDREGEDIHEEARELPTKQPTTDIESDESPVQPEAVDKFDDIEVEIQSSVIKAFKQWTYDEVETAAMRYVWENYESPATVVTIREFITFLKEQLGKEDGNN